MDPNQVPTDVDPTEAIDNPQEDTDWQEQAEELKARLDKTTSSVEQLKAESNRNIRRLQSSYTSTINDLTATSDAEKERLEDRYHAERMDGMDEQEALRYENARLAEKLETAARDRDVIQQRATDAASAASYISQFANLGVPQNALNTRGSLQDLADSGWAALANIRTQESMRATESETKLQDIQTQLDALKAAPTDPNALAQSQGDLQPPAVATHTPGDANTTRTMHDVAKSLESYFGYVPSEEEVYRAIETGRLNSTILPGMESLPKA